MPKSLGKLAMALSDFDASLLFLSLLMLSAKAVNWLCCPLGVGLTDPLAFPDSSYLWALARISLTPSDSGCPHTCLMVSSGWQFSPIYKLLNAFSLSSIDCHDQRGFSLDTPMIVLPFGFLSLLNP